MLSFQKSVPNSTNKLKISTEEDNQLFIFEINLNKNIKIRQLVKNRCGLIVFNKNIEYDKIKNLETVLLDLRLLKEYKLNGNMNTKISETILSNEIYTMKFTNINGNLKIFYEINC